MDSKLHCLNPHQDKDLKYPMIHDLKAFLARLYYFTRFQDQLAFQLMFKLNRRCVVFFKFNFLYYFVTTYIS